MVIFEVFISIRPIDRKKIINLSDIKLNEYELKEYTAVLKQAKEQNKKSEQRAE